MKKAILFGHTSGLGLAVMNRLLGQDYEVVGVARTRHNELVGLAQIECDVADEIQVQATLREIRADHSRFDVLIYAAGALTAHSIDRLEYSTLEYVYKVNAFAPMIIESALLDLVKDNEADIVNITSSSIVDYYPQFGEYSNSKAALAKFTHDVSTELRNTQCRVRVRRQISCAHFSEPGALLTRRRNEVSNRYF